MERGEARTLLSWATKNWGAISFASRTIRTMNPFWSLADQMGLMVGAGASSWTIQWEHPQTLHMRKSFA